VSPGICLGNGLQHKVEFLMGSEKLKAVMDELARVCKPRGRQKQVAKELGVSEQVLSNWINGSRIPMMKNYFKIEDFLKKHPKAGQSLGLRKRNQLRGEIWP
jgi:transcriptional regulator with XRE-family HTH domain